MSSDDLLEKVRNPLSFFPLTHSCIGTVCNTLTLFDVYFEEDLFTIIILALSLNGDLLPCKG